MLDRLSILQGDPLWLKIVWVPFRLDPMSPNPNYPNLGCFRFRHDHDVCFSDCLLTLDLLPKQEFFGPNIIAGLQKRYKKVKKPMQGIYVVFQLQCKCENFKLTKLRYLHNIHFFSKSYFLFGKYFLINCKTCYFSAWR